MKEFFTQKAKEVFGSSYEIVRLEQLLGGAQKRTWLAERGDGFRFVVYQWDKSAAWFQEEGGPFCSNSPELFARNNAQMARAGVLTPKLYYMDGTRSQAPFAYAFVEYIDGPDMDFIMEKGAERLPRALDSLRESIGLLHAMKSPVIGQLGQLLGEEADPIKLELAEMEAASLWLRENDPEYAPLYLRAQKRAEDLARGLGRRGEYSFIHSELGPNHVIVDREDRAWLIDIEGARYFDPELENSFLRFRFNGLLTDLPDEEDPARMAFYHIGHCFGNLRGAVELRQKGYYDMDDVNGMIRFFHAQFEA